TTAAPPPACPNSNAWPPPLRPGGRRFSRSSVPASPTPAPKAPTGSSKPSPATPTASATRRTNDYAPAAPPPDAPADTSTPPKFEEPAWCAAIAALARCRSTVAQSAGSAAGPPDPRRHDPVAWISLPSRPGGLAHGYSDGTPTQKQQPDHNGLQLPHQSQFLNQPSIRSLKWSLGRPFHESALF